MEIDLPPSSAFTPDPSVARARSDREGLTLTLKLDAGPDHVGQEMSEGAGVAQLPLALLSESLRAAIAPAQATAVTITF
jgi:hypothetical protein